VITYSLTCANAHTFDAWFRNAAAYDEQHRKGIVTCPVCMSAEVEKAPMAPAVARGGPEKVALSAGHPQHAELMTMMRALRRKVVSEADYVGDRFAEEARRIHFREADPRGIYGEATREEVAGLVEDGIDFLPLPTFPDEHN
jgi:hypothetical protein